MDWYGGMENWAASLNYLAMVEIKGRFLVGARILSEKTTLKIRALLFLSLGFALIFGCLRGKIEIDAQNPARVPVYDDG